MNSSKISEWVQIIGIFAVVLSLIFVGLQMQQTQEIAKATLYQMRSDSSTTIIGYMIASERAREVSAHVLAEGVRDLSPEDRSLHRFNCEAIFGHFENSHHLHTLGFLADEQWEADRRQLAQLMKGLCQPVWTQQTKETLRASFVDEIDNILRTEK